MSVSKGNANAVQLPRSNAELLGLYVAVLDELRARSITRSNNLPTGDYAEFLVAEHFGVDLQANSFKGFDLRLSDKQKTRIQVKSRRVRKTGSYGNFGVMRGMVEAGYEDREFDAVVAVVFEYDYRVREAWWIPWRAAKKHAGFSTTHKAARLMQIKGPICKEPGVKKLNLLDPPSQAATAPDKSVDPYSKRIEI